MRSNFNKPIEELRLDLKKEHDRMVAQLHERNQKMLQNSKLQMQPQVVPVSDLYLYKVTSQKIFVSDKTKPSKYDPSSFRKPTQLTKLDRFHQLMTLPWEIVTTAGLNGFSEDKISTITQ